MSSLSVSSYGSYSSTSNASAWATARSAHQAKMFAKADSDSSGGVNQSELNGVLQGISQKTGGTFSTLSDQDKQDLFKAMDSDSSGELSSDELAKGMDALRPDPPSTLAFAQSRQGQGQVSGEGTGSMLGVKGGQGGKGDDLFSKLDSNGDGSLDSTEVKAFADKVTSDTGNDISDQLSKLDTDQSGQISQSEFDAGRPSRPGPGAGGMGGVGGPGGAGGPPPMGGMPPGGGMGGASSGSSGSSSNSSSSASSSSSSSSSGSYDPLDTNRDGKVSDAERLAAALKKLYAQSGAASQSSSSNNTSNSSSTASSSTSVSITV